MPKKKASSSSQLTWRQISKPLYGTVLGAAVGTAAWFAKPAVAVGLLVALLVIAAYVSVVLYQRATSRRWSPRKAFSAAPILGALVVGVVGVAGAMYLGSSHANENIQAKHNHIGRSSDGKSINGHSLTSLGFGSNAAIGNIGSIVNVQGCNNLGSSAIGNIGSIIKVDGGGTCDVNDIARSFGGIGNIGSIIIVDNACGTLNRAIGNIGSIIKVTSHGPCKPDEPTTVVVQVPDPAPTPAPAPVAVTPAADPAPAPVAVVKPAALPDTGPGGIILIALIAIVSGYLFSALYRFQTNRTAVRK